MSYQFPNVLLFAIPNGGYRSWRQGAQLKREGVRPGVPDLHLAEVRGEYHGLWLELKQPGNRPTDDQIKFLHDLRKRRYAAVWCDSAEDALHAIERYLGAWELHA